MRGWGRVRSLESDLLTSLDPDLDDRPEPGHVLQENHPTGRRSHVDLHTHTHGLMLHTKTGVAGTLVSCDPRCGLESAIITVINQCQVSNMMKKKGRN